MLQKASTKLRHLDPCTLSCLAATGTSENVLMALLGNVDSRRNTSHIRSGAFQSHFSNSSYSSILAQVVWGVKIPSSTMTHVGYNQYIVYLGQKKPCVFFIDNSLSAQLVPWLPIPAQSELARNWKYRGLFAWIWDLMCVLGEHVQGILLQGRHNVVLAFPCEHHLSNS